MNDDIAGNVSKNQVQPALPIGLRVVVRLLCLGAFAISGYLLYGSLTGERLPGCGLESGCGTVLRSRWAYIFGLPVSLPALALYAAVFGATFIRRKIAGPFLTCAGAMLLGAALYFVCLQLFVIGSICRFCMGAHTCGFFVGALLLANAFGKRLAAKTVAAGSGPEAAAAASAGGMPLIEFGGMVFAGLLLVGLLALGQVLHKPKTFSVEGSAGLASRKTPGILQLHGTSFQLDLRETPVLGSPEAPMVVVHLFDYTCPHCRRLHPMLKEVCETLSNQVAIASLLVPLATNCNRYLKRPIPEHTNACEIASAGLAVWRAAPEKLHGFEDWIFSTPQSPLPDAVRAKARELVGTNEFDRALADPWIKEHLTRNINLYATNYIRFRKSVLPELMVGTNLVSGTIPSVQMIYKLLEDQFGILLPSGTNRIQ